MRASGRTITLAELLREVGPDADPETVAVDVIGPAGQAWLIASAELIAGGLTLYAGEQRAGAHSGIFRPARVVVSPDGTEAA